MLVLGTASAPPCPRVLGNVHVGTAERRTCQTADTSAAFAHPTAYFFSRISIPTIWLTKRSE